MSRIVPIKPTDNAALQAIFEAGEKLMGFVPNDGLIMAHRPDILKAFLALVQAIYAPGEVEDGLKRLIGLVVSSVAGCTYCQAHAANAAYQKDESIERIKAVWEFRESPLFSAAEKAALEVSCRAATIPNEVREEDFNALKRYFSEPQIVEILSVVSMYGYLNRWNASLQTELEEPPATFFKQLKKE